MNNRIQEFDVLPQIPEDLVFLCELSENLWWSWNSCAFEFFERLNPRLWKKLGYNPKVGVLDGTKRTIEFYKKHLPE